MRHLGTLVLAFVLICVPMYAQSVNVPFAVQATFPSFSLGAGLGNSGTWTITGTGNWLLDASAGTDTQTLDLSVSFPALGISVPLTFTGTGLFEFALETHTNRVGILAENQGSMTPLTGVKINLIAINSIMPIMVPIFPPYPTTPPSPLSLPPLPSGFRSLPPSTLPPLSELGSTGTFMAAGTANILGLLTQEFRGTGTVKIVPSNAKCPAGTANPVTVLTGTWTFNMDGQVPLGTPFDAAGQFTASSSTVNNVQVGILSLTQSSSTPVRLEMDSGQYQIFPDCSGGTLTFNVSNRPLAFDFWFDDAFGEIRFVSTTPDAAVRGSAKRF